MYPKLIIICVVLAAVALAFQDWDGGSDSVDFRYLNRSDVHTLDPAQMSWTQDFRVAMNLWEGLTTYHPQTTQPQAGAAYFPPDITEDALTYTFTLNPEGRWSNGDPVTADDFLRGWRRVMEPGTAADYAFLLVDKVEGARAYFDWRIQATQSLAELWGRAEGGESAAGQEHEAAHRQHVEEMEERFAKVGLRAIDDYHLKVKLTSPCAFFLDLCAFPTLLPIHESIEVLRDQYHDRPLGPTGLVTYHSQWTKPDFHPSDYPGLVTNGPYRLQEWTFKRRLLIEVNPYFRDAASISCKSVEAVVYDDLNSALMAYEAGQIDFITDLEVDYVHELVRLSREGLRPDIHVPRVFGTYYFIFNCGSETVQNQPNPFRDARVRKAFAISVDKQLLVEKVLNRGDPVSDHLVPVGSIVGYFSPAAARHDPAKARELLAKAGFPNGAGLPIIEILYNTGYQHGKVSEFLAEVWSRELGVRVSLVGKEAKTFSEDKVNQRYMLARAGWYGDYGDPTTYLDIFATGNGNNDAAYSNPAYDSLLKQAEVIRDPQARYARLAEAEALLINQEFPVIPLYQYTNPMAIQPWVHGLTPNPRLVFPFRYVNVER